MTNVVILSGVNGSGKSFFLEKMFVNNQDTSFLINDFEVFKAIKSSSDLINMDMSRGLYKATKLKQLVEIKNKIKTQTLLIDDIDTYLHPDVVQDLITDIVAISPNIQNLVVATHSPMLILRNWQSNVVNIEDIDYDGFLKRVIL